MCEGGVVRRAELSRVHEEQIGRDSHPRPVEIEVEVSCCQSLLAGQSMVPAEDPLVIVCRDGRVPKRN